MSTDLNYSALTGSQIAEGLTALASIFASTTEILDRHCADQGVRVTVGMASGLAVEMVAAELGVDFERKVREDGTTYTTADIGVGPGRPVEHWQREVVYTHPVALEVYAIDEAR